MEFALQKNDWKGGWQDDRMFDLLERLREETDELRDALFVAKNFEDIIKESADIANFAMMIADNVRRTEYVYNTN